jgi:phospholipase/carboxylesterase
MQAIWRPPADGRPTVLALHGRGSDAGDLVPVVEAIDRRLGVLAPRGPEREGPGYAWFRHHRIGVPVIESLRERLAEVAEGVAAAAAEHGIELPMLALGFSNGGMMAGALAATRSGLVGRAILLSSAYPLPEEILAAGGLAATPVFLGAGDADPFHSLDVLEAGAESYRRAGAIVTVRVYPGLSHGIGAAELEDVRDWLTAAKAPSGRG